jgi:uncharacterized membrane protein
MSYQAPPPPGAQANQGMAIGSLICGILSIGFFCIWWLSIPLGIVAVVLAVMAKGKIARGEAGGAGLAKAGMICGIIGAVLSILITVLAIVGISMFGDKVREMERRQRLQQQQQGTTEQFVLPAAR